MEQKNIKVTLVVCSLLFFSWGAVAKSKNFKKSDADYEWVGDMLVPKDMLVDYVSLRGYKQKGIKTWYQGVMPIAFSSNVSQTRRNEFFKYCEEMGEFADVQCVPRRSFDSDYVYVQITNASYCGSSYLGKFGGKQPLKIRCWRKRTIQHELMHAYGISHEHNREDRDDHLTLLWDNMSSSAKNSYKKIKFSQMSHRLNIYDIDSIMHYGSYSGSANGKPVFYVTARGPVAGIMDQTNEMSYGDHLILWALYGGERP